MHEQLIINFKAVMMSYCLCFMLLWLNAKNNFQLNQQKLILNHELSTYLETIQKMSVCIFSHINANIYATRLASDQNGTQIFIRYCLYEIYCFDSLINSQKMHLFII